MASQYLSTLQKKSLANCDFSSSFVKLFEPPSPSNIDPFDEFQSLETFIEMENRVPNEKGTGRNVIDAKRKTLYLTRITCEQIQKKKPKKDLLSRQKGKKIMKTDKFPVLETNIQFMKNAQKLFSAYFGLATNIIDLNLTIKIKGKEIGIIDDHRDLFFPLKHQKKESIDVFSLFDVMIEYIRDDCYSLICFLDYDIYDPEIPENLIYGRACGDRVAIISMLEDERTTLHTALHETMHTMGIDHCQAWKCLMNSFIIDSFEICPMDLKKLEIATKYNLLEREQRLLKIFKALKFEEEIQKTLMKIKILKKNSKQTN